MGKWYVIDNCVAYCNERNKERAYQIYVTDILKLLNDNLAHAMGGNVVKKRFAELLQKPKAEPKETAGEIVDRMKQRLSMLGGEADGGFDGTESYPVS